MLQTQRLTDFMDLYGNHLRVFSLTKEEWGWKIVNSAWNLFTGLFEPRNRNYFILRPNISPRFKRLAKVFTVDHLTIQVLVRFKTNIRLMTKEQYLDYDN